MLTNHQKGKNILKNNI